MKKVADLTKGNYYVVRDPRALPRITGAGMAAAVEKVSEVLARVVPKSSQNPNELPDRLIEEGIGGRVRAEAHIKRGKVVEVRILSGHRLLHPIVRSAMMRYECQGSGDNETVAVQDFNFKIE